MAAKTRPRKITFRLSDEELELFNQKLQESGKTQQEYCRLAVLGQEIKHVDLDGIKDLLPELKRQGNNLNQIAKAYNETGMIEDSKRVRNWITALNEMYSRVGDIAKKLL